MAVMASFLLPASKRADLPWPEFAPAIDLTEEERKTLNSWARGRRTEARLVLRAKIVLLAATGAQNKVIAVDVLQWLNQEPEESQ